MRRQFIWLLLVGVFIGCRTPSASNTAPTSLTDASAQPAETQGFSIGRMLQFVGFQAPTETPPTLIPQEVIQLGQVTNAVIAQASQLNVNDPPQVTQQKAQSILESLQPWDTALAASRSVGLVNDETANLLNTYVGQIRTEAQKLVQYLPAPETITAIQQLAGSLQATVGPLTSMFAAPNGGPPISN